MSIRLQGFGASPGLATGRAVVMAAAHGHGAAGGGNAGGGGAQAEECPSIAANDVEREVARFARGVELACAQLEKVRLDAKGRLGAEQAAIFEAQLLMAQDPYLAESVVQKIRGGLVTAECACMEAFEENAAMLAALDDVYLAARAADIREMGARILLCMAKDEGGAVGAGSSACELPAGSVVVAENLAAANAACLDPGRVRGVVLRGGGSTSHTSILLRALGIPAVVSAIAVDAAGNGAAEGVAGIRDGDTIMLNGDSGEVVVGPDEREMADFQARAAAMAEEQLHLAQLRDLPSVTLDSRRVELSANIGGPGDIKAALDAGAEGVGLFRTECFFIDRPAMPSEDEQFEAYRTVLTAMAPRPVIVRTLDAGGDKHIPYLNLVDEANPFLGLRAIRLCLQEIEVFRTQLRALLRASAHGNLRIMFPMVATRSELLMARAALCEAKNQLADEGVAVTEHIPVGIMVEIPSAAVCADVLARECDFFSIGTNDLVQYTMACDRGNPSVGYLNDPFSPAILRLIAQVIEAGRAQGIPVGMCGEMAGMPLAIPLLVGMGINELSMAASSVPRAKQIVRSIDSRSATATCAEVRTLEDAAEIRAHLANARWGLAAPPTTGGAVGACRQGAQPPFGGRNG